MSENKKIFLAIENARAKGFSELKKYYKYLYRALVPYMIDPLRDNINVWANIPRIHKGLN